MKTLHLKAIQFLESCKKGRVVLIVPEDCFSINYSGKLFATEKSYRTLPLRLGNRDTEVGGGGWGRLSKANHLNQRGKRLRPALKCKSEICMKGRKDK